MNDRRKFRRQTSDNMDRWKRGGKSERKERKKKEDQRRETVRRKKMQVYEKVEKSRNTVFFQCVAAQEGWKVGLLKRRVQTHLGRWEIKNSTPLWREAHPHVKMPITHHRRSTFASWDTPLWGAKHVSKSKCSKHHMFGPYHATLQLQPQLQPQLQLRFTYTYTYTNTTTTNNNNTNSNSNSNNSNNSNNNSHSHSHSYSYSDSYSYNHCTTLSYATLRHTTALTATTTTSTTTTTQLQYIQGQRQLQLQLQPQLLLHYTRLRCTTATTAQHNTTQHYTTQYNDNHTTLRCNYSYNYNCATPHYIQQLWLRWPLQPSWQRSSSHISVHQWIRSAVHAWQHFTFPK